MRAVLFSLILLTVLPGCRRDETRNVRFFVFGTIVDIKVRHAEPAAAEAAFEEIQQRLQAIHRDWHAWSPGQLSSLNQAIAAGQPGQASTELINLLERAQFLEKASHGYFNPAIGGLVELWGFHTSQFPVEGPPPPDDAIQAWLDAAPSMADLELSPGRVASRNRFVQLDLGGIAKGYAVDQAMGILDRHGIHDALVDAGGDLRAASDDPQGWKVGVLNATGGVLAAIVVRRDEAVFTSGVGERYREHGGRHYAHVLNPRTGHPVEGLQSVTVMAADGTTADAAATALLAAGPDQWPEVAAGLGVNRVLVLGADGRARLTPAMAGRVEWMPGQGQGHVLVSLPDSQD